MKIIFELIYQILYAFNAKEDMRTGYVYVLTSYVMLPVAYLLNRGAIFEVESITLITLFILVFFADREEKLMGRGDYPIIISSLIYFGDKSGIFLMIASISSALYCIIRQNREVRFVPFLFLSNIILKVVL